MEQILGLVLAVLLSVGASWLDKWWKAYKRTHRGANGSPRRQVSRPASPPPTARPYSPQPPIIMSPENEGGSIIQLKPTPVETPEVPAAPPIPDATAPDSPEVTEHYRRWRQAIIDAEVLAPRSF